MEHRSGLLVGVVLIVAALVGAGLILARQVGLSIDGTEKGGSPTPLASFPPPMAVEDLYAAFEVGGSATSAGDPTALSTVPAAMSCCRPVGSSPPTCSSSRRSRSRGALPVGRHPVLLLSSARDPDLVGDVAAAMIRVAPGDPVSWELAVVPGQDVTTLQPGEFFGYPVDSGTGAFASAEAVESLLDGGWRRGLRRPGHRRPVSERWRLQHVGRHHR